MLQFFGIITYQNTLLLVTSIWMG